MKTCKRYKECEIEMGLDPMATPRKHKGSFETYKSLCSGCEGYEPAPLPIKVKYVPYTKYIKYRGKK